MRSASRRQSIDRVRSPARVVLRILGGAALLLAPVACSTPIGTRPLDPIRAGAEIEHTAVDSSAVSADTRIVLRRYDLERVHRDQPAAAIDQLHARALTDNRRDILFALAELNYHLARRAPKKESVSGYYRGHSRYLTAALYAYYYLSEPCDRPLSLFAPHTRQACDLYNLALAQAFLNTKGQRVLPVNAQWTMPVFGHVAIEWPEAAAQSLEAANTELVPAAFLQIRGLTVHLQEHGLGAPMVASENVEGAAIQRCRPLTLTMRPKQRFQDAAKGGLVLALDLVSPHDEQRAWKDDPRFPLEADLSAPFAYTLNNWLYWGIGLLKYFTGTHSLPDGLYSLQPYQKGLIPVIFVHGFLSSPAIDYGEMLNVLKADPILRQRYQFWVYVYESGQPTAYSARHLQNSLRKAIERVKEQVGETPQHIVVVGFSQGGLLTKLTATDTGEKLIEAVTHRSLKDLGLPPELEAIVRDRAVFTPVPGVERVIFIATPHRGSYLACGLVRTVMYKLSRLPSDVTRNVQDIAQGLSAASVPENWKIPDMRTSVDSMSPNNPGSLALADIPVAPKIKAHSIIAVQDLANLESSSDTFVGYTSAHVDYAVSELVLRDKHPWFAKNPLVMEEVRRILLEHLAGIPAEKARGAQAAVPPGPAAPAVHPAR